MPNTVLIKRRLVSILLFLLAVGPLFFNALISECYAEESIENENTGGLATHVWDRYVRRFRRDHNLSASAGYQQSKWTIGHFGDIENQNFVNMQESMILEYTFHILISGKTGYFLGTNGGYINVNNDQLGDQFQPSTVWLLPGARAGLVYNYDPTGRIFMGIGAQLARFNNLGTKRITGEWQTAGTTGESFQLFAGGDLFFLIDTAVHFAWTITNTYFPTPVNPENFLVDQKISQKTQGAELGLLYHFL